MCRLGAGPALSYDSRGRVQQVTDAGRPMTVHQDGLWKVNPSGVRTRFAGVGDAIFQNDGDGGPARLAHFDASATALAAGPDGSVYVAHSLASSVASIRWASSQPSLETAISVGQAHR